VTGEATKGTDVSFALPRSAEEEEDEEEEEEEEEEAAPAAAPAGAPGAPAPEPPGAETVDGAPTFDFDGPQ
jgi:hypothetical protein